jgi:hypothetical protein
VAHRDVGERRPPPPDGRRVELGASARAAALEVLVGPEQLHAELFARDLARRRVRVRDARATVARSPPPATRERRARHPTGPPSLAARLDSRRSSSAMRGPSSRA